MIVFELSGPKLVSIPNFSSISLQMADFSLFCGAKSCEVPSVILLPGNSLKLNELVGLAKCVLKVRKFQLDTLSRFRMVEEKQEGTVFYPTYALCRPSSSSTKQ